MFVQFPLSPTYIVRVFLPRLFRFIILFLPSAARFLSLLRYCHSRSIKLFSEKHFRTNILLNYCLLHSFAFVSISAELLCCLRSNYRLLYFETCYVLSKWREDSWHIRIDYVPKKTAECHFIFKFV